MKVDIKLICALFCFSFNLFYSQKIEFRYEYKICSDSTVLYKTVYDSKTTLYEEVNYNYEGFIDKTNINEEIFRVYIPLDSFQRGLIINSFFKSNLKKSYLKKRVFNQYNLISLTFYKEGMLINDDPQYIIDEKDFKGLKNLLDLITSNLESSKEYLNVFRWR